MMTFYSFCAVASNGISGSSSISYREGTWFRINNSCEQCLLRGVFTGKKGYSGFLLGISRHNDWFLDLQVLKR